jgi:hypothetical protein
MRRRLLFSLLCLNLFAMVQAQGVFMPNKGQWQGDYAFRAGLSGGVFFARNDGWTVNLLHRDDHHAAWDHFHRLKRFDTSFSVRRHALRITLLHCTPVQPLALEEGPAAYNYFLGNLMHHQVFQEVPGCSHLVPTQTVFKCAMKVRKVCGLTNKDRCASAAAWVTG